MKYYISSFACMPQTHLSINWNRALPQRPTPKEEMEKKNKQLSTMTAVLLLFWLLISPALSCPSDGSECKDCIVDRIRNGCPSCVPVLRCMARCLWGGTSKSKCVKRCDCYGGKPRLSDCKKCMSRCKCSCEA